MNIALYIRVSTDRQAQQGDSLENQIAVSTMWVNKTTTI